MFIRNTGGRAEFAILVAIESDPERTPVSYPVRPAVLDQADAEQMLAHLTADLGAVLKGIGKCQISGCGALLDQCQVLRPGLPVYSALSALAGDKRNKNTTPGQFALGAVNGRISDQSLTPDPDLAPAVLLVLPLLVAGPSSFIEQLAEQMEHRFLSEGQISAHSASWLEAAFGIGIRHARFMTLTDLNAMFRIQMENFGFLPLWELVDAAVNGQAGELALTSAAGTAFCWRDDSVNVLFQPFNHWAVRGSGIDIDAGDLGKAYAGWSHELRQYTSTLAAHHVAVRFDLPDGCNGVVGDDFIREDCGPSTNPVRGASITEHSWPDLGIVAVTAQTAEFLSHYYPLVPQGLNSIHEMIRAENLAGEGMSFPGRIAYDESSRQLRPGRFEA